jgi:hypothetical protein
MRDKRLDHCSRRYGPIGRGSGHCHIDARACGEGVTENRDVSGHTKRKAEPRKLRALRNPIILQNGGWNGRRARLVRGLPLDAEDETWAVLLSDSHTVERQRVTVLEELWHILLSHKLTKIARVADA